MSAYIYPDRGLGLAETHFELKPPRVTVGRHPNNDVSLLLDSISRFHARVDEANGVWSVTDLNSSNGTFVNTERVSGSRVLEDGDVITFGRADFTFSEQTPSVFLSESQRKLQSDSSSSSVSIVPDSESSSTILSTQLNVENTPLPGGALVAGAGGVDIRSLQKANERLLTLYKLSETIRAYSTREDILRGVMDLFFEVMPADRGVIMTNEPDGGLELQVVRFRSGATSEELTISKTIIQKCLDERIAILSRDAKIDSRFGGSESILAHDIRSAMCIPLVSKKTIMGIFFIDTKESVRTFTEDDLAFATSFANEIALTLDNLSLTQEKIKNERLAAVGQTIAGLAHNIKNILQLAKGGIELMDNAIGRKAEEEIEVYWPVVRRGIERMHQLTQEMLDYSRQSQPELQEASVNEVIDDTVRSFMQDQVNPGVTIDVALEKEIPTRRIDPNGLYKALLNLIGNSVDAFDGGAGTITVATAFQKGTIYVTVEDDGKGIPKDKLGKIFQPFWSSKGSKGTGLGLPMTKKYIEDMGGTLGVESEEGRGTKFTIALPPLTTQITVDVERERH